MPHIDISRRIHTFSLVAWDHGHDLPLLCRVEDEYGHTKILKRDRNGFSRDESGSSNTNNNSSIAKRELSSLQVPPAIVHQAVRGGIL